MILSVYIYVIQRTNHIHIHIYMMKSYYTHIWMYHQTVKMIYKKWLILFLINNYTVTINNSFHIHILIIYLLNTLLEFIIKIKNIYETKHVVNEVINNF